MPEAEYQPARGWSFDRRKLAALGKVLDEDWTIARAVSFYGVDRKTFARHLRQERVNRGLPPTISQERKLADEAARRQAHKQAMGEVGQRGDTEGALASELSPGFVVRPDFTETRRVPPPDEFDRIYFGHFICPDCDERHPSPPFHSEISAICQDPGIQRGVILTPPYHAKTTRATVRDTVHDLCKDPNSRTLIISETGTFAENILSGIKGLLTDHSLYVGAERNLIEDWGPFKGNSTWNKQAIIISGRQTAEIDPNVQVIGYRGQIYGRRADKIKSDDIASFHNQADPDQVKAMLDWFDGQVLSRIGRKARMLWIGTRVRPGDIYEHLIAREGYTVMRYSAIADEATGQMLWPEHFPYDFAKLRRTEMDPSMWELVYQNVDQLTAGTSFPGDALEAAKDLDRHSGSYESGSFLIAGLDPAGGGKDSGYTAFVLMAVNPHNMTFQIVDAYREKQMKAPDIKAKMLEWSDQYKPYEWRVEVNGLQRQLFQYNEDIVVPLAARGIPISPHVTNQNKWDAAFGVESMIPMFTSRIISIPWASPRNPHVEELVKEIRSFPLGSVQDLLMAMWFSVLGCRDITNRPSMPMFDKRTEHWPGRVRKRRHLVNFSEGVVQNIPLHQQHGKMFGEQRRRQTVGVPTMYPDIVEGGEPGHLVPFLNREGYVRVPDED